MKVLVISAHTDDAELGMGATIRKHTCNDQVKHIVLSPATLSNAGFNTKKEWFDAQNVLGVQETEMFNFETRMFWRDQHHITQYLYDLNRQFNPDIVYTHTSFDRHQDHEIVHKASVRVFKNCDMYGYPLDWNNTESKLVGLSLITQEQLNKKIEALYCYESQKSKSYFNKDYITAKAISDGINHNCYGENLEVLTKII